MAPQKHIPVPKNTKAFICADCGAVSLDSNNICNPKGRMKKADWCGSKDLPMADLCHNRVNNDRYKCNKCGKASINEALLCEPEQMPMPK